MTSVNINDIAILDIIIINGIGKSEGINLLENTDLTDATEVLQK